MHLFKSVLPLFFAALMSASYLPAQIKSPAPSPYSELHQVVGVTHFTVKYSRPGVKGRTIYGDLVPYGKVWRTGANATTKLSFDSEIEIGGETVPAGEYVLFTIPGEDAWTVILYGDLEVRNAGLYDPQNDIARFSVEPVKLQDSVENFTIGFDFLRDDSAVMYLDWANVRIPIKIEIDTDALVSASLDAAMTDMEDWTAADYASAAGFYNQSGTDPEQALEWMAKAVSMNPNAFWWQHQYAKMLSSHGKIEQAIAAAEKSLQSAEASEGGDFGYIERNRALIASLR